ncbi:MAG: SDR family NAD(P)-dependent oxidoreductase, partial [Chthoniobacterales bacterium]|nr:SDR family NAD(P)-dependent oxidoreductase [Chthoniobacterales bacterium]
MRNSTECCGTRANATDWPELCAAGIDPVIIAKDLEQENAPQEIFRELQSAGMSIGILVNNAGHGQRGLFWEIPLEQELSMLRLNAEAVLRMTRLFLPAMIARGRGRVLNTASVAGFEPGPMLAVYHATKSFVFVAQRSSRHRSEGDRRNDDRSLSRPDRYRLLHESRYDRDTRHAARDGAAGCGESWLRGAHGWRAHHHPRRHE